MNELLAIIEEEASIMEPENPEEEATQKALYSALDKIREEGPVASLTPAEKAAVKYALQDVGELYLFTGSSAGFDVESKAQEKEHQNRGEKARTQAAAVAVYL